MTAISKTDMDILFNSARTFTAWKNEPVSDEILMRIYDLAKMAPTAANCQPMRIVYVKSREAKELLKPCLDKGNVDKVMSAPATAIIAGDAEFYNHFDKLFPFADVKSWYVGKQPLIDETLARNTALQGAYFILAARALGLDCGPMSGFDNKKADDAFFKGTPYKSNFLCNIGYGDASKLYPRAPRFDFKEACKIA